MEISSKIVLSEFFFTRLIPFYKIMKFQKKEGENLGEGGREGKRKRNKKDG